MADTEKKNLMQKAAAVLAVVEHVPKNGWNDFHKYKYATEADITSSVRAEMARQGLMLIPSVEKVEWTSIPRKDGSDRLATLTVKFTLTDGNESFAFTVLGEGADRSDKATYKAMTGALKYALLKLFLIPTGDDPEKDDDEKPAPRTNGKASADAAAKVRAAAAKTVNATPIPGDSIARKADLFSRMKEMGIPGAKMAEQLGEWLGHVVDKSTEFSSEDWSRADAAITQARAAAETLARAKSNVEAAFAGNQ
jgi:hypothetical protein